MISPKWPDILLSLTDWFVFQVNIDAQPILGHLSEVRPDDHESDKLDYAALPLSDIWAKQPPKRCIHILVKLPRQGGSPDDTYVDRECPIHLLTPAHCVWCIRCQKMQMAVMCLIRSLSSWNPIKICSSK